MMFCSHYLIKLLFSLETGRAGEILESSFNQLSHACVKQDTSYIVPICTLPWNTAFFMAHGISRRPETWYYQQGQYVGARLRNTHYIASEVGS